MADPSDTETGSDQKAGDAEPKSHQDPASSSPLSADDNNQASSPNTPDTKNTSLSDATPVTPSAENTQQSLESASSPKSMDSTEANSNVNANQLNDSDPKTPGADVSKDGEASMSPEEASLPADEGSLGASAQTPEKQEASGTGPVTETSPIMEDVKQRAAEIKSKEGHEDDPGKDIYHLKWIKFKGRRVPIVTQNLNGPCPLIALINVLLLRGKITLDTTAEVVTSSQLMGYLGDIVLQTMPQDLEQGEQANWEQNVNDAIAVFHKLQTGLDVNVRFTGVSDFEYTSECIVFDLLNIALFHGWLVDTSMPDTVNAVGNLTYNQLVEKVIENSGSDDADKATQAVIGQLFLDESASQLTYHGLSELASTLQDDQMAVFFRNNHFSTIFKSRNELFLLVTDQGYLRESRVVWETLANVEGDGHLVDSDFHTAHSTSQEPVPAHPNVEANTQQQVDQDMLLAMSLNAQLQGDTPQQVTASVAESDEAFAKRLQEEENRAVAEEMQAQQTAQQQNPQQQRSSPQGQQRSSPGHQAEGQRSPQSPAHRGENPEDVPERDGRSRKRSGSCVVL